MLDYKTKAEILVLGVRTNLKPLRRGGGGPIGGVGIGVKGSTISAPALQWFAKNSPYEIKEIEGKLYLFKKDELIGEVFVPKAEYYKYKIRGVSAGRIVALDGINALVTAVSRRCVHIEEGKKCKFCVIDQNVPEKVVLDKRAEDIALATKLAYEEDRTRHLTLTTGTINLKDKGALRYAEVIKLIRKELDIPIHVQIEPVSRKYLEILYSAGADTIGIHVETFDENIRKEVVPGKPSIKEYLKSWEDAVDIFGEWKVDSWLIIGLGESLESVISGFREMAERGVIPYIAPYRPPPGSKEMTNLNYVLKVYDTLNEIKKEYKIDIDKCNAGCVRCGGCSAIVELLKSA